LGIKIALENHSFNKQKIIMKTRLNITLFAVLFTALVSCSTGRYASAQYDANEDTYSNSNQDAYPNSPDNYDNNNENYNDNNDYNDNGSSEVSIDVFVDQLSPYGRWVNSPSYGQVWVCNESGFTPYYTNGHWVYTNFGWTWVSNYNWGWAPFHYGRWAYDPFYGWMWVPGYEWGPAWVGWRTGGDYYGWAPLAPGINISLGFSWGNYMPANRWCFVPRRYISDPYFHRYAIDRGRNVTIINNTTIIKNTNVYRNTRYVAGPSRTEVERFTGNRVNAVRINNDTRPGGTRIVDNRTIRMYKPQIKKDDRLTPERVNADRTRIMQSQQNHNQNVPLQQHRNIQPQQSLPPQQNRQEPRIPQRNNVPATRDRKPNINDRIDNNLPDIRRDDNSNIPDNRRIDNQVPNRNDRFNEQNRINQERLNQQRINQERLNQQKANQERLNQERMNQERNNQRINQERLNQERANQEQLNQQRINQQNNNRPDSRMERRDFNSSQNRPAPHINQQPATRGWQSQQMPERRVQPQSNNQYQQQQNQGNGRRRN
jgi:hypothetical protein